MGHRLADLFHGRPRLQVGALLAGPVGWLVIAYLGSLLVLFINAFWSRDPFTGLVIRQFTLDNFAAIIENPLYRTVTLRTVFMTAPAICWSTSAGGPHGRFSVA